MASIRPRRANLGVGRFREVLETFLSLHSTVQRSAAVTCQCKRSFSTAKITRNYPRVTQTPVESPIRTKIDGNIYPIDEWTNLTPSILSSYGRNLHLEPNHPICLTRQIIERNFPSSTYATYNLFPPVVSTHDNFDVLNFPKDHPGRSKSDTYYVNKDTVLRTHTSAHQSAIFRSRGSPGFLISGDVYRRDAIDRSHYPVFHQMEGARTWNRLKTPDIVSAIREDMATMPKSRFVVEDPNPHFHPDRNPRQAKQHTVQETEAVAEHLKRTLENMVFDIFSRARAAAKLNDPNFRDKALKARWVEAYFPFTAPSWELEVLWKDEWLEVLGCGVVQQHILVQSGIPNEIGWAFGMGLERIAMLLFDIPDIRLFWSVDERFLNQFKGVDVRLPAKESNLKRFVPFSKYPATTRNVSFWIPQPPSPSQSTDNMEDPSTTTIPSKASEETIEANTPPTIIASAAGGATPEESSSPNNEVANEPTTSDIETTNPPTPLNTETTEEPITSWRTLHENDIMEIAREFGQRNMEDVKLVDEFVKKDEQGREMRSLSYQLTYRSLEMTLTGNGVNAMQYRIEQALVDRLGVKLR